MEIGGRQSGRTTKMMLAAPKGAVFVWCNEHLDYPKRLARDLGRDDLRIVSREWLRDAARAAAERTPPIIDHAAVLTERQYAVMDVLWERYQKRRPVEVSILTVEGWKACWIGDEMIVRGVWFEVSTQGKKWLVFGNHDSGSALLAICDTDEEALALAEALEATVSSVSQPDFS